MFETFNLLLPCELSWSALPNETGATLLLRTRNGVPQRHEGYIVLVIALEFRDDLSKRLAAEDILDSSFERFSRV